MAVMRLTASTTSVILHFAVLSILLFLLRPGLGDMPSITPRDSTTLTRLVWRGEGGGGQRDILPPSFGAPPPPARRDPFVLPPSVPVNDNARLTLRQALLVDSEVPNIAVDSSRIGSPFGVDGPLSGGRGGPGGIGDGKCCGIGDGKGNSIGGGTAPPPPAPPPVRVSRLPQAIYSPEPEYSEEARKAKYQGTVVLTAEIDAQGNIRKLQVVRPLGLGLDEKAAEAVARWRFRPAMADGKAVAYAITIEVSFRLL